MINSLGVPVTVVDPGGPTINGKPARQILSAAREYSEGPKGYVLLMMRLARSCDYASGRQTFLDAAIYVTEQLLCEEAG